MNPVKYCITIHEYSHYLVAKALGLKVIGFTRFSENQGFGEGEVVVGFPEDKKDVGLALKFKLLLVALAPFLLSFIAILLAHYFYTLGLMAESLRGKILFAAPSGFMLTTIVFGLRPGINDILMAIQIILSMIGLYDIEKVSG